MIGWYCVFHEAGSLLSFFDPDFNRAVEQPCQLGLHETYLFKARVETLASHSSQYSLKIWKQAITEPAVWNLTTIGTPKSLQQGALLLGAHHVAASFGNVVVNPLIS